MAHSARHSHRRRSPHGRYIATVSAPVIASIAVVALTLMLIGTDLVGNTLAFASMNPTPTPSSRVIDGPIRPIELPTRVPTRDIPILGVPTEVPVTEEVIQTEESVPTEEAFPTEDVYPTDEPAVEERRHVPEDGISVSIWKLNCPEGTESNLAAGDYAGMCQEVGHGIEFSITGGTGEVAASTNDEGKIGWSGLAADAGGELLIRETIPEGYGFPAVFCGQTESDIVAPAVIEKVDAGSGTVSLIPASASSAFSCWWYNIPTPEDGTNGIRLWKSYCPPGTDTNLSLADYMALCTDKFETTFTLSDPDGLEAQQTDANGYVHWVDINTSLGKVSIQEAMPNGYLDPLAWCVIGNQKTQPVPMTGGYLELSLPSDTFQVSCKIYNIPVPYDEPASLTIVKYTCPEGYDLYAPGANPGFDCPTLTDGVTFVLDDGMPGLDLGGITGDGGNGVVTFADVEPGSYTVHELLSPDMGDPFVLKCEGDTPQLQPYPLWTGNDLPITLTPGNAMWCFWYNVPADDPDTGTLTVTKYACTTETFVSTVDCQVYEGGQVINLLEWDGAQWDMVDVEQTDAFGRIVWTNLPIGHYLLAEPDTTWCHIESSAQLGNDGSFNINLQGGMDQTVDLYNCGFDPEIPEGTPTDWPNTGVGESDSSIRVGASAERRIPPVEGGDPAIPTATRCLAADDPLATSGDAACPRGAVPSSIQIDAIGVDAPIEVKETVGGQMQQPTGETAVAWYKESPRLGESGNMLFAGHLNWWGFPEAVFFRLDDLQDGDEIVVTDASGTEWTYRVNWVRQDDTFAPPSADVVGPTNDPSITLITCGGEWNADTGLYDKRTVVRAELVSGPGMD